MWLPLIVLGLLAYILPLATATTLTYKLNPNEKACFFTYVESKGAKVAFYFAVTSHPLHIYSSSLTRALHRD